MKRLSLFFASVVTGAFAPMSACSLIVLTDAEGAVCADDADCGAGFVCDDDGACASAASEAIPTEGLIDSDGGVVSAHGLTLTVPAGALDRAVVFIVEARSATLRQDNVDALAAPVRVEPLITFVTPATLSLDGEGALFRQPDDEGPVWERLSAASADVEITRTGTFVVGSAIDDGEGDDDAGNSAGDEGSDP